MLLVNDISRLLGIRWFVVLGMLGCSAEYIYRESLLRFIKDLCTDGGMTVFCLLGIHVVAVSCTCSNNSTWEGGSVIVLSPASAKQEFDIDVGYSVEGIKIGGYIVVLGIYSYAFGILIAGIISVSWKYKKHLVTDRNA